MLLYRKATIEDVKRICSFTDWWLAGRGRRRGVAGAVNDYFISPSQHRKYVLKYETLLVFDGSSIIGWAVRGHSSVLIHLLVAADRRGEGIGRAMVAWLRPKFVRSKLDQSSGDPAGFYEKIGYTRVETVKSMGRLDIEKIKPLRKANIDIFVKGDGFGYDLKCPYRFVTKVT